jgi:hypothetical protein
MNIGKLLWFKYSIIASIFSYDWVAMAGSHASPKGTPFSSPSAILELEKIDDRKPLPLSPTMANHQKKNMREHLETISAIVNALAQGDFASIEKAVKKIGYSEEMGRMCTNMGSGAPGFSDMAIGFHKTADTIADAARFKDLNGVLRALDATLKTCTGCHAQYRQQIIDKPGHESMKHHRL